MTITINPTASQNPFTDSNLTQTNSGTCAADGSSLVTQQNASTTNIVYGNATFSQTQSCQATLGFISSYADMYALSRSVILLYTDSNNYAWFNMYRNSADNNNLSVDYIVGGSQSGALFASGIADTYFSAGDTLYMEVTWSGANATFTAKKNGTTIGTPQTINSFGLTSGKPGFFLEQNGFGRGIGFSQLVLTGESGGSGSGIVSIKGNRGPRVAFGTARTSF